MHSQRARTAQKSNPSPGGVIRTIAGWTLLAAALVGCNKGPTGVWQGYVEGDFVQVASPLAGRLQKLSVEKGSRIQANTALFTLEHVSESAARAEAEARLRQAEARLADLEKGQRPSELAALEARLAQSQTAMELSSLELARAARLHENKVMNEEDFDRARLLHESNSKLVAEAQAVLATAKLGARADQILAARAEIDSAKAALERAEWSVNEKSQLSASEALVFDTLYREGEFVAPGTPVLTLLPPGNVKIRFFVPESEFASIKAGDTVLFQTTGQKEPIEARVFYLSQQPEYTPPVLYNRENRSKLVFMIEARPVSPSAARDLHPGQPADVRLK